MVESGFDRVKGLINTFTGRGSKDLPEEGPILRKPGSGFTAAYDISEIVDMSELDNEIDKSVAALKEAQMRVDGVVIRARSPQDVKDYQNWQANHKKTWDIFHMLAELDIEYENTIEQSTLERRAISYQVIDEYQLIHAGGKILMGQLINGLMRYGQRQGHEDVAKPYLDMQRFVLCTGLDIRIAGCSLWEIMGLQTGAEISTRQAFRYIIETQLIRKNKTHKESLKDNQSPPMNDYPNKVLHAVDGMGAGIMAALHAPEELITVLVSEGRGLRKEVAQNSKRLHERIQGVRQSIFRTLLNPNSPDFEETKSMIEYYLQLGRFGKIITLYAIGLHRVENVYEFYRKVNELSRIDEVNRSFYDLLGESTMDYVNEMIAIGGNVLTVDDVAVLISDENETTEKHGVSDMKSLARLVSNIFQKSSQREYSLDPQSISWELLVEPKEADIIFDRNRPNKFGVHLLYENDEGELLGLEWGIDTTKDIFDWNFTEHPAEGGMQEMRRAIFSATESILSRIQQLAGQQYEEKRSRSLAPTVQPGTSERKTPREHRSDEIYVLRKQIMEESRARDKKDTPSVFDFPELVESEQIRKVITIPEPEAFLKLLQNIGFADQRIVQDGITEFNTKGIGEFTRKRRRNKEGDTLYTLRVNCSVPKGVRVLLREANSVSGQRNFEILSVRYRKDTYKKAGI